MSWNHIELSVMHVSANIMILTCLNKIQKSWFLDCGPEKIIDESSPDFSGIVYFWYPASGLFHKKLPQSFNEVTILRIFHARPLSFMKNRGGR